MVLIVDMVSSAGPLRASATIGVKSMPADQQAERLETNIFTLDPYLKCVTLSEGV